MGASAAAIDFEISDPIIPSAVLARCNPKIFLIVNAPITIATVDISKFLKKSLIPLKTSHQSILATAVFSVLKRPCTQTFIVSANALKSKSLKNRLIPAAMDSPRFVQSKVFPKESAV